MDKEEGCVGRVSGEEEAETMLLSPPQEEELLLLPDCWEDPA